MKFFTHKNAKIVTIDETYVVAKVTSDLRDMPPRSTKSAWPEAATKQWMTNTISVKAPLEKEYNVLWVLLFCM